MAKQQSSQNTSSNHTDIFTKGLNLDANESFQDNTSWLHARNAVNNSQTGDLGMIENEPSNLYCTQAPYTIIGAIHMYDTTWAVYSTDDTDSEIGLFDENLCTYTTLVNDRCLSFKKTNLITGAAKENYDCSWQLYWEDGLNPSRTLNVNEVPYKTTKVIVDDCVTLVPTTELDCDKLRLARLVDTPCITMELSEIGTLFNGTYQAWIAYTEDNIKVTDYLAASNLQSIFTHENNNGSLKVNFTNLDTERFDEFVLVMVSYINRQASAFVVGYYSTQTQSVTIDYLDQRLTTVAVDELRLNTPAYEKADAMYTVQDYLLRVGPKTRLDFNYQPLANKIKTEWVAVEYDQDYYKKGGNHTSYLRDEQYSFFIRWVYNTGEKSNSYHIPGRQATAGERDILAPDGLDVFEPTAKERWEVYNTAKRTQIFANVILPDGGKLLSKGDMGYWQSTEKYPDDKPEVWDKLCGKPIRHHKMPDDCLVPRHNQGGTKINVLGVQFSQIRRPVDNQGNVIDSIVGYEILRGSRKGNKSIIAKGILNNMFEYSIPGKTVKGLYPNYPFNDIGADPYLTSIFYEDGRDINRNKELKFAINTPSKQNFTFHSPDTQFKHPFLQATELRIYGDAYGTAEGRFIEPEGHPKHKMLTDTDAVLSILFGLGNAMRGIRGKRTYNINYGSLSYIDAAAAALTTFGGVNTATAAAVAAGATANPTGLAQLLGLTVGDETAKAAVAAITSQFGGGFTETVEASEFNDLPVWLRIANVVPIVLSFTAEGADNFLDLIRATIKYRQYAVQHVAHGFYDKFVCTVNGAKRRKVDNSIYIKNQIFSFGEEHQINNLFRSRSVALRTFVNVPDATLAVTDNSKYTIGTEKAWEGHNIDKVEKLVFNKNIASKYVALKIDIDNQYGQISTIAQQLTSCIQLIPSNATTSSRFTSDIIFGGDVYITRYTEKDTMFFFNRWLAGRNFEDGVPFDYRRYVNVPYPRHYINTEPYKFDNFVEGISTSFSQFLTNLFTAGNSQTDDIADKIDTFPSDMHNLDRKNKIGQIFSAKGFFYLFNSGVKDFFVESEINCAHRDHDEENYTRHYEPGEFTDLETIFKAEDITRSNTFKYDWSLSAGHWYGANSSYGSQQRLWYDPQVAESCHTYYPNRVIYSLPQGRKRVDNWRSFLVNNKKDFKSSVTAVKSLGMSGALIMLKHESPMYFIGADTLQSSAGAEITIGDGGLFDPKQNIRNIMNTDAPYEYGSCQNKWAISATAAGIYYVSQNQGKVFSYQQGLTDITSSGVKWWLSRYLPYQLLQDYPGFQLTDNPVIGVGVSTVFDNLNMILYVTKKDYKIKPEFKDLVSYNKDNLFRFAGATILLGDPQYFDDASWTISYDVKNKMWISFHDWHPSFVIPAKNYFMSVKDGTIWKHNVRCDSYCNFYGVDYPFEMETIINTNQDVNTLRSVEYQLECYQYKPNCQDKIHLLDFNFDRAVVYNSEQVSGMLHLNVSPKNDPSGVIGYPQVNPTFIDILYSKEENKYRFNQFWDITTDRGEFSGITRNVWDTAPNGYIKTLNTANLNYSKDPHQHKKFRHYNSILMLRRNVSGPVKMKLRITNGKLNYSFR